MKPTLYIVMRDDIPDMNPGKGMAQAAHAQADFEAWTRVIYEEEAQFSELVECLNEWKEDRTFGRTLVLHATAKQIEDLVKNTSFSDTTVDPTYPWRNHYGQLFVSEEMTCAWVFMCDRCDNTEIALIKEFPLHP